MGWGRTTRGLAVAVAATLVASACSGEKPKRARPPSWRVNTSTTTSAQAASEQFALGVEYTELGLADLYASTGVHWAKTRLEAFEWGRSEPNAPTGDAHHYDWTCTDALVREYQDAGITDLQSYLSPESSWASAAGHAPMVADQYLDAYRAWVGVLIERYDDDGTDDMPGLRTPIRDWVVGGEWTGFWGDADANDYLKFLTATREAGRAAYADVQFGTIPFFEYDVFEGNPSAARIKQMLTDPSPVFRKSTAGLRQILDHPELFEYVDVHSLGDATEIPPMMAWFRDEMKQRGYDKPIWIDDAFPMNFLVNGPNDTTKWWPLAYPMTESLRVPVRDLLERAAKFDAPATAWVEAEVAKGTIKKAATALGENARGINIGNTEDWTTDAIGGLRHLTTNFIGAAAFFGMADVTHPDGMDVCDVRRPGEPRPALRNLELAQNKLGGGDFDRKTRVTGPGNVSGYQFTKGDSNLWVLWVEDGLHLPDDAETPTTYELAVPPGSDHVNVTTAITKQSQTKPDDTNVVVNNGVAQLSLTSTPVFVES